MTGRHKPGDTAATGKRSVQGRQAFEHLNAAHRILLDPGKRVDEVAKRLEEARKRAACKEANATGDELVALNAAKSEQVRVSPPSASVPYRCYWMKCVAQRC